MGYTDTEDQNHQQAQVELEKGQLIQATATRWNLLFIMIFCILKNKEPVKATLAKQHKIGLFDNIQEEQSAEAGDHPSTTQAKAVTQLQVSLS